MRRIFTLIFVLFCGAATAQKFNDLALTPPMGWNSWNKFACDGISEKAIRDVADAMVTSGMKDAGYQYIVIDDCWQVGRDSIGNIIADEKKFPSGIKALADYIHSKGLKFGIYSCAGKLTCAGRPGSRGYEFQDARTYAKWGVDYLKLDWCNSDGQTTKEAYTLMRDALYKAGRPIVFSICEWGNSKPWYWAQDVGHLWRTTGDIENQWGKVKAVEGKVWGGSVVAILDMQAGLDKFAGPGHWNDPDMLEVGNGGLTVEEERAHFSLWCMIAAPLIAGNDLSKMSKQSAAVLTNKDVIAIDQDKLGKQGYKILDGFDFEIYMKPLAGGDTAICLFNRTEKPLKVNVDWAKYKIGNDFKITDLWAHKSAGSTAANFKATIARHDVKMLRLSKK
ncbi:glycoside hydrolase family 27 protein [Mucilaginibacter conchicola]|uniref:Alpha-galactosidase n=1 Tax=Mucilaginibacter conchicola TaxID=2303333 RepID=A0A372NY83_9SPHI|nr:glycoside hydrolase family 27 protein [Mucilaginibacter conchicola]RFZ94477.1 glycoside hydrolase family 27 protein [Mucilaginibacter conchicola]